MSDYARDLLDELMGPDRDLTVKIKKNLWDEKVCKHFLVGFCPNLLFINTKSDLGPCGKIHDEKLQKEYQELPEREREKYDYESKFFMRVRGLIRDLDWKLRDAKKRIEKPGDELIERQNQIVKEERDERIVMIEENIKELQSQLEQLGEEGLIDEAQEVNTKIEGLNLQLASLRNEEAREKKMEACEVCGALLVVNDAPERVEAHLKGKQHTGFQRLRETYDRMKDKYEHRVNELKFAAQRENGKRGRGRGRGGFGGRGRGGGGRGGYGGGGYGGGGGYHDRNDRYHGRRDDGRDGFRRDDRRDDRDRRDFSHRRDDNGYRRNRSRSPPRRRY